MSIAAIDLSKQKQASNQESSVAAILCSLKGQLEGRLEYLRDIEQWIYSDSTSLEKLKVYVQRRFGFDGKGMQVSDLQKKLKSILEDNQDYYRFFLKVLKDSPDFNQLYISLKAKSMAPSRIQANNDFFARNKKKDEEKVFMQELIQQLNSLVDPVVLDLSQYLVEISGTDGQSGFDFGALCRQEIVRLFNPVHELSQQISKGKYNFTTNEIIKNNFADIFGFQFNFLLKDYKTLNEDLKNFEMTASKKNQAIMLAGGSPFERQKELFILMRDKLINIRNTMTPFKTFYAFYLAEIATRENLHKTLQIIQTTLQTKIQKFKDEFKQIEEDFAKKQLDVTPTALLESKKILSDIEAITKESEWLKQFVIARYEDPVNGLVTAGPLLREAKALLNPLLEYSISLDTYFVELRGLISPPVTPDDTKESSTLKPSSASAASSASSVSALTPLDVSSEKPVQKKILKPIIAREPMTKEKWDKLAAEEKQKQDAKKQEKRRTLTEESKKVIELKNARQQLRLLSDTELKKREARIKNVKLNKTIMTLFESLYINSHIFGHKELMSLVEALKMQGEDIKLQSPSGGSSHYSIIIGSHYGFFEEDFLEKGKAFRPSDPKILGFPKDIIKSLQSAFTRSGFTVKALGIATDNMRENVITSSQTPTAASSSASSAAKKKKKHKK